LPTRRLAIAGDNAAVVEMRAYTLKGTVSHFEAHTAGRLADELETLGRQGTLQDASEVLQRLEHELERIVTFFTTCDWKAAL
jgi:hypothetical protein